jgi:two-component system, NarL family, nitrate/nitrite response regulator NarL
MNHIVRLGNLSVKQQVRIVIADSNPKIRYGLWRLLEAADFKVVGEAVDGLEAVKLALELKPDILLMELSMPKQNGLEALRELNSPANATPVRVILLTAVISKIQVVEALAFGARGVVLKDSATQLLVKAMRTVLAGEYWLGRERVPNVVEYLRTLMQSTHREARQKESGLKPRELEIVAEVVPELRSEYGFWGAIRRRIEMMDPYGRVRRLIFTAALATCTILVVITVVQSLRQ